MEEITMSSMIRTMIRNSPLFGHESWRERTVKGKKVSIPQQCISVKRGKGRNVSKNTVTYGRLSANIMDHGNKMNNMWDMLGKLFNINQRISA
jgi:hypothetical protein